MQGFDEIGATDALALCAAMSTIKQGVAYYDKEDRIQFWNAAYEEYWPSQYGFKLRRGIFYRDILRTLLISGAYPEAEGREGLWLKGRLEDRKKDCHTFERQTAIDRWVRMEQTRTASGGLICISIDITALKETTAALEAALAEAEAATEAKSAFLAVMSHEIRTPLNGVLGMAQAMDIGPLPPLQRERLAIIRQSGESLLAILNDILDISKIEAGKLVLETAPFDIEDLARGAYAIFTALANAKGLSFSLTVDPRALGVYVGDSSRIRQILYNLISNALKFTAAGEVRVKVDYIEGAMHLAVHDTGVGIVEDKQALLFGRFVQADASTTRRFGGSGLGLSICRDLAMMMGGDITLHSVPALGSTFTVRLGIARAGLAAKPSAIPHLRSGNGIEAFASKSSMPMVKVLAAEDNEINQLVLKTILHQMGIDALVVNNGVEAVAAWEQEVFDVILMDVQMPVMDGPTAATNIRRREALRGGGRTPIVALTANVMAHQMENYRQSGMDDVVAKPIQIDKLAEVLEAALNGRRDEDQQLRTKSCSYPERRGTTR